MNVAIVDGGIVGLATAWRLVRRGGGGDPHYATGHYRHGILMAPVTACSLVAEILGEPVSEAMHPFLPTRFHTSKQ